MKRVTIVLVSLGVLLSSEQSVLAFTAVAPSSFSITNRFVVRSRISVYPPLSTSIANSEHNTARNDVSIPDTKDVSEKKEPLFESFGKGILRDFKSRRQFLRSDVTDGLTTQSLAATLFMFFACLAPAVGFGSAFAAATGNTIGTIEMVSSTALCGILYAMFSAQPLTIIGSTGPVLAFVATLSHLANKMSLPFLPLYAWTGLWTSAILALSSVTSASNLVHYLTRFTDEIFSVLISCIFFMEASSNIWLGFSAPESTLTKGLLTLICTISTYVIASSLKKVRQSVFFNKKIRERVSDFGPTIGVIVGSLIARMAWQSQGVATAGLPSLSIPAVFGTTTGRPWLVPIFDLPVWARWASFLPALMASVLLFLDQNITVRLVNNPRWKMRKGRRANNVVDGMHLDMLVLSLLTAFQSVLGFPWLVAATVRSLSHVSSLREFNEEGETKGVVEQRVTGVGIHALIGFCVLFAKPRQMLTHVPIPVLMGLFMYLGASALPGNEIWERILGVFKDKKVAPKEAWTGKVPPKVVNLFTLIQVACLGGMFWVKESRLGVFFPVLIAMLAPLKIALEKKGIIKKQYMEILDSE